MKKFWNFLFKKKKQENNLPKPKRYKYVPVTPAEEQVMCIRLIRAIDPEAKFLEVEEPFDNMDPRNFSYQFSLIEFMLKMISDDEQFKDLVKGQIQFNKKIDKRFRISKTNIYI